MHYLEEVIPAQIEDKVQFLATKEDMDKVEADLKEDISKVEVKVVQVETRLTTLILSSQQVQTRWMVGILIAIFMTMLALYFKK